MRRDRPAHQGAETLAAVSHARLLGHVLRAARAMRGLPHAAACGRCVVSARHVIAIRPRSESGAPLNRCACGALALPYLPTQRQGHAIHGDLICYHADEPTPENCTRCGAAHNNANPTASGLCAACQA